MKRRVGPRKILLFVLMGILAVAFFGGVVMALWNNVLVKVTNVQLITFWQALGLLVLSKILFGGFRGGWGGRKGYWKQRMQDKWSNMTPNDREKFKEEWQKRCRTWGNKSWNHNSPSSETVQENAGTQL